MTKKRVIIGILIAILLIAGITVNIIALKAKTVDDNSTNIAKNVDKVSENKVNEDKENKNVITEEDLELSGEPYKVADVQDKDGNTIPLERENDKPMVILFWNTEEELGVEALKILQSYYEKYSEKIIFASIAVVDDEQINAVEDIIAENNITILNVYDKENSASEANNVTKFPTIVAINKKGEIINTVSDEINEDIIEANLDIIAENY